MCSTARPLSQPIGGRADGRPQLHEQLDGVLQHGRARGAAGARRRRHAAGKIEREHGRRPRRRRDDRCVVDELAGLPLRRAVMQDRVERQAHHLGCVHRVLMDGDSVVAGDAREWNVDGVGGQVEGEFAALAVIVVRHGIAAHEIAVAVGEECYV